MEDLDQPVYRPQIFDLVEFRGRKYVILSITGNRWLKKATLLLETGDTEVVEYHPHMNDRVFKLIKDVANEWNQLFNPK